MVRQESAEDNFAIICCTSPANTVDGSQMFKYQMKCYEIMPSIS
jgi:hypothetical protein